MPPAITSSTTQSKRTLTPRLRSLLASTLTAIASSTPYIFALYAPQLMQRCHFTPDEAATLSIFLSAGSTFGGFPMGIAIDKLGPGVASFIGSVFSLIGFSIIYYAYRYQVHSVFLVAPALSLSSLGSIASFFASIKATTANFPRHRGTAGAFPVSGYALGSLVYSWIGGTWFNGKTSELLVFITMLCFTICGGCSFFMRIYHHEHHEISSAPVAPVIQNRSSSNLLRERLLTPPASANINNGFQLHRSDSISSQLMDAFNTRRRSFTQAALSFWGVGRTPSMENLPPFQAQQPARQGSFTNSPINGETKLGTQSSPLSQTRINYNAIADDEDEESVLYAAVEDTPIFVKQHQPIFPSSLFSSIFSRLFIKYYITISLMLATGQFYIYNIGFVVVTLVTRTEGVSLDPDKLEERIHIVQSLQVSIIAVASFFGRLTSGPISDIIAKKLKAQRLWGIVFGAILMASGHYVVSITSRAASLSIPSLLIGTAFGFVFGTFPAIIADEFGTGSFSTIWGLITTGGIFVLGWLNKNFAKEIETGGVYTGTFIINVSLSFGVLALVLFTIWVNWRKAQKSTSVAFEIR